jgi:hypothetical protein
MIQKLLLILLASMLGISIFMIREISNKINSLNQDYPNSTANISPAKSTSSSFEETKMPLMWSKIKDNGIKKIYLSYADNQFDKAMEIVKMLEKDNLFSVFLAPNGRNDDDLDSLKFDLESMRALKTMDIFLTLYSSDYFTSHINNQEYGFALSRDESVNIIFITETGETPILEKQKKVLWSSENKSNLQPDFIKVLNNEINSDIINNISGIL